MQQLSFYFGCALLLLAFLCLASFRAASFLPEPRRKDESIQEEHGNEDAEDDEKDRVERIRKYQKPVCIYEHVPFISFPSKGFIPDISQK